MKIPEGWKLVPVVPTPEILEPFARVLCEIQKANPDATDRDGIPDWYYMCGDIVKNQLWQKALIAAPTPPAQEDEPVGYISQASLDLIAEAECQIDIDVWKQRDHVSPHPIYTRPDNSELRKAAEELLRYMDNSERVHRVAEYMPLIENLRAALEGK